MHWTHVWTHAKLTQVDDDAQGLDECELVVKMMVSVKNDNPQQVKGHQTRASGKYPHVLFSCLHIHDYGCFTPRKKEWQRSNHAFVPKSHFIISGISDLVDFGLCSQLT